MSSGIAAIVHEENCGLVVAPNNVDALRKAIDTIKNNQELRKQMAQNGRLAFEKRYTTTMVARKYKQIIEFFGTDKQYKDEHFK